MRAAFWWRRHRRTRTFVELAIALTLTALVIPDHWSTPRHRLRERERLLEQQREEDRQRIEYHRRINEQRRDMFEAERQEAERLQMPADGGEGAR